MISYVNKKLSDICNITTGKLNANAMIENGKYPFFTCSKEVFKIDKFSFDTEALLISGNGSQVGHIHHYIGKFDAYQRTYVLTNFSENAKYIKYILHNYLKDHIDNQKKTGGVPYITLPTLEDFEIKVPPLEVQKEIVEILDKFTTLEAELEAELEARRKQYEYYSNKIFLRLIYEDHEEAVLSDYFYYKRGNRLKKSERITGDIPLVTAGFQNEGIAEYISNEETVHENAITIDMFGNAFWRPYRFHCDDNIICLTGEQLNSNSAHYYLNLIRKTMGKFHYNNQYRLGDLQKHVIPLPIKDRKINEEEIISKSSILEKFANIVEDIEKGLPKEIELRRKQYEYYRNKLLTFEEQ